MKTTLTIAGSDSSGGAGIQADLKTFSAHGVYGMSVITAITAQNTQGVQKVENLSGDIIKSQLTAIFEDIPPDAVKIGMVSTAEAIHEIAAVLNFYRPKWVVLDPVMISKSGYDLLEPDAKKALIEELLPLADIVTPNLMEAGVLIDQDVHSLDDMKKSAGKIRESGPDYVLVKGGHLEGDAIDLLFDGTDYQTFSSVRIQTKNTHGTGCTLSSAIASQLAQGKNPYESIRLAKQYIQEAIRHSLSIGKGVGPTHHFYKWFSEKE